MSDNYEFAKSCLPQGVESETPYVDKSWAYINDINGGVYAQSSLSLVQFDLSSLYNSSKLIDLSQAFLAIPITYVSSYFSSTGASLAPTASGWASTALKSGYFQLVNGGDLIMNGKTIEQYQNTLNAYVNFKVLSQMSQDDLNTYGASLGMGTSVDNWQSQRFNGQTSTALTGAFPNITPTLTAVSYGGQSISNNLPFSLTSNGGDQYQANYQQSATYNKGLLSRMVKLPDITTSIASGNNGLFLTGGVAGNAVASLTQLQNEFKPNYQLTNTSYMTWTDVAIVRMSDLFDSMSKMPLTKKADIIMRLYLNVGSVVSNCSVGGTQQLLVSSGSSNTFTSTCPLVHCALSGVASTASPATATGIASALFIGSAKATSIACGSGPTNINLGATTATHFMSACRFYYPQVTLKPEHLTTYISENRAKKVVYTSILTNNIASVGAGSSYSQLIQSGITSPRGVLIIPLISATTNGLVTTATAVTAYSQLQSPFDMCPATSSNISLTNLQVALGGVNVLANTISYGYEEFLEQVSLYEKINGASFGLSCGLINEDMWSNNYRVYYVDLARSNKADLLTARNLNISFTNNSLQSIDCIIITEVYKEIVVDVETGLVSGI